MESSQPTPLHSASILTRPQSAGTQFQQFVYDSGNEQFKPSGWTWASLAVLLVAYPGQALVAGDTDVFQLIKDMGQAVLVATLIFTIAFQWGVCLINYVASAMEGTGFAGLGLGKLRPFHFFLALAFLLVSNLILSGVAWVGAQVGYPQQGELGLLIPEGIFGKVVWVLVSFTAGFCEEVAFRGYLMTRLRLLWKTESWLIPSIISSALFGICHIYQGMTNVVLITLFGLMFSIMFIRNGSLWPCIIAHFLNNAGALFFPR